MNGQDLHLKMMDKFLDKLFEKKAPLTEEEMDDLHEQERGACLMVWDKVGSFRKVVICQCGKREPLMRIAQILERNGYEAEVS